MKGSDRASAWLFPPDSVTWRVGREAALLLGGGRALLLQLAHPGVAAGVAEHSDFRTRPLSRLLRTLSLTLSLSFGTRAQALEAARAINRTHERVQGEGYSATDPRLLLWVHATLINGVFVTCDAFVRKLEREEREAYYAEAQTLGTLLGIPARVYPTDLRGFEEYLEGMLSVGSGASDLEVDERARTLAAAVLHPPMPLGATFLPVPAITAGLLPPRLRETYGLRWGRTERAAFAATRALTPRLLPVLPRRLRYLRPPG